MQCTLLTFGFSYVHDRVPWEKILQSALFAIVSIYSSSHSLQKVPIVALFLVTTTLSKSRAKRNPRLGESLRPWKVLFGLPGLELEKYDKHKLHKKYHRIPNTAA